MTTFVVTHGAWGAGWFWKKMRPLMHARGHAIFTPTYTGIGERAHLLQRSVNLETHITDVLQVLKFEDLHQVVLVGHSYGGMVATGVADRAADRIAQVVYVDAFVPRNGDSALSLQPSGEAERIRTLARDAGDGWLIPPNPMPADSSPEDIAWGTPKRTPQPLACFEQALALQGAVESLPRGYIYCEKSRPGDVFRQFYERAQSEAGWKHTQMPTSHNPQVTMPIELMEILHNWAI
jgi:pimeloyl-ACP methyl ester carboxylesterase